MKKYHFAKVSLGWLLCLVLISAGCCINIGGRTNHPARVELERDLESPARHAARLNSGKRLIPFPEPRP